MCAMGYLSVKVRQYGPVALPSYAHCQLWYDACVPCFVPVQQANTCMVCPAWCLLLCLCLTLHVSAAHDCVNQTQALRKQRLMKAAAEEQQARLQQLEQQLQAKQQQVTQLQCQQQAYQQAREQLEQRLQGLEADRLHQQAEEEAYMASVDAWVSGA